MRQATFKFSLCLIFVFASCYEDTFCIKTFLALDDGNSHHATVLMNMHGPIGTQEEGELRGNEK